MKAAAFVVAALLVPAAAANAQAFSRSTGEFSPPPDHFYDARDTPTMQREKRNRALALRQEAAMLLEQDGGTLTREHNAYLRRKAHEILGRAPPPRI